MTCTCSGHTPTPKPSPTRRVHTSPARATPRPAAMGARIPSSRVACAPLLVSVSCCMFVVCVWLSASCGLARVSRTLIRFDGHAASYSAGRTSYSRDRFCWLPANDLHRQTKSHMKGNVVTKLLVTLNFKFNVTDITVTIPLHSTVPHRPTSGTLADRPTLGITYPLTDRPDGRPWASDRSASRGNTSGRRPIAWDRPHRPYTRTRTYTR